MAGSIEKRGKDSWRLVVSNGYNAEGKRIRHTRTIKATSRRQAEKELAKFIAEVETNNYISTSQLSLSEFAKQWLESYVEVNLQPTTANFYKLLLRRILRAMGHLKLNQIKPLHLLKFYDSLREDGVREDGKPGGLSPQMILHHHRCISAMLQDAVEWQLISSNPASKIKAPKVRKKESEYFTEEEIAHMLNKLVEEDIKYHLLIALAVATGLRKGELLGLEWKHINFTDKTLKVCQSTLYINTVGVFTKETKNQSSNRVISLPDTMIRLLKEYKNHQDRYREKLGDQWEDHDRLFTQWNGKPMHPGTVNSWFQKFLERNYMPKKRFHSLRHTNATMLIAKNVDIKTVSMRLGHAKTDTTLNIYAHALKESDREAAEKLDSMFF